MLAILLTIPQTPFHDTARAVKILSESTVSRPRYDSSLQELSSLLLHLLAEQKVQEARNARVLKQLNTTLEEKNKKEHQHKMTSQRLSETLSRMKDQEVRNDQLDKELGKERARVETLQNKIEQLKLIEKSIIDRKSPKEPTT
jgi:septal ring factor EnvC (AmiA/AmiB activator)